MAQPTTETAVTTTPKEPAGLAGLLRLPQYSDRFKEVLRDRAPQFISSLIQVGRALGPDCEPKSIIGSAMVAAALNLPIDKNLGFSWIIAYKIKGKKVASFQMGYKGYVQLALRTGQYSRLSVCEVYDGELQGLDKLTGDLKIDTSKRTSDKVIGYASYLRLTSGFEHAEYWSVETVKAHATRYSQSYRGGYDSPWKTHFDEMAKKTVLSMNIRRWGPMSVEVHKAYQSDQAVFTDVDSEPEYVDNSDVPVDEKPDLMPEEITKAVDESNTRMDTYTPEKKRELKELAKAIMSEHGDNKNAHQLSLIALLDASEIPHDVFINWINVNGMDKKLGFDASALGSIAEWPADVCEKIGKDTELMTRAVKRFGKKV